MNSILLTVIILFNFAYGQVSYKLADISIRFVNRGTYTDFVLTYSTGIATNNWIGVGFNDISSMVIFFHLGFYLLAYSFILTSRIKQQ
jgi:hypothetical protein